MLYCVSVCSSLKKGRIWLLYFSCVFAVLVLRFNNSRIKIEDLASKINVRPPPPVVSAAVHSKAVIGLWSKIVARDD